jgi:TonB family protein
MTALGLAILCGLAAQPPAGTPPVVLQVTIPEYPQVPRQAMMTGAVVVRIQIEATGSVRSAVAESGPPLLRPSAELAARRWRFAAGADSEPKEPTRPPSPRPCEP